MARPGDSHHHPEPRGLAVEQKVTQVPPSGHQPRQAEDDQAAPEKGSHPCPPRMRGGLERGAPPPGGQGYGQGRQGEEPQRAHLGQRRQTQNEAEQGPIANCKLQITHKADYEQQGQGTKGRDQVVVIHRAGDEEEHGGEGGDGGGSQGQGPPLREQLQGDAVNQEHGGRSHEDREQADEVHRQRRPPPGEALLRRVHHHVLVA